MIKVSKRGGGYMPFVPLPCSVSELAHCCQATINHGGYSIPRHAIWENYCVAVDQSDCKILIMQLTTSHTIKYKHIRNRFYCMTIVVS